MELASNASTCVVCDILGSWVSNNVGKTQVELGIQPWSVDGCVSLFKAALSGQARFVFNSIILVGARALFSTQCILLLVRVYVVGGLQPHIYD